MILFYKSILNVMMFCFAFYGSNTLIKRKLEKSRNEGPQNK